MNLIIIYLRTCVLPFMSKCNCYSCWSGLVTSWLIGVLATQAIPYPNRRAPGCWDRELPAGRVFPGRWIILLLYGEGDMYLALERCAVFRRICDGLVVWIVRQVRLAFIRTNALMSSRKPMYDLHMVVRVAHRQQFWITFDYSLF